MMDKKQAVNKPQRKLIVATSQGWYNSAYDTSDKYNYNMSERLLFMENALNHTENALFASNQKLEQQAEQIKAMREILGDVLSDCELSNGMRSEIIKRMEWDGGVVAVSECLHTWRMYHSNTICVKCNSNIINVLADRDRLIAGLNGVIESQKETNIALASKVMDDHKFTELGRLALKVKPCYFGYDFRDGDCLSVRCSKDEAILCKAWNELMAEGCE